jgi:hypothetical protein
MGAEVFRVISKGKTANEAFKIVRDQALHDYGHAGYTGSIAEKHTFTMIPFDGDKAAAAKFAERLIDDGDKRIDDKWGPAGCIDLKNGEFMFFGWASS